MPYIGTQNPPDDDYVQLETEVMMAMLDLANIQPGERHLELGSGENAQFVVEATARGAISTGYEIDEGRYLASQHLGDIVHMDCMDIKRNVIRSADCISFWFTDPSVYDLMVKLYKEMSSGARLVCLFDSRREFKDGIEQQINKNWNIDNEFWIPTIQWVDGNEIHLFVR